MNMNRKGYMVTGVLVMLSFLIIPLAGCGGSSSSDSVILPAVQVVDCATVTSAATVTTDSGSSFNPASVVVAANSVVRWNNASATVNHTVTSGTTPGTPNGTFDQTLNVGTSVCLKFPTAGTYNYYCTFHYTMGMTGVVTVQ